MWSRTIILGQMFFCLCTGSGVQFVENKTAVKLRSSGSVNIGHLRYSEQNQHESIRNRVVLKFNQLRFMTPSHYDIFQTTGHERYEIQPSGFKKFREMDVHGMAMVMNISALGILLKIKSAICKQDDELRIGEQFITDVRHGDVVVSLELTPGYNEDTDCIACQLDNGHVILLDLDVKHGHLAETGDVVHTDTSAMRSVTYSDSTSVYIPEKIVVDGKTHDADLTITELDNKLNLVLRLPTPLGESTEVSMIFRLPQVPVVTEPPPTTSQPEPEVKPDDSSRDVDERSHDQEKADDHETEHEVIDVKYTTTTAYPERDQDHNVIAAVREDQNQAGTGTNHVISVLAILTSIVIFLL